MIVVKFHWFNKPIVRSFPVKGITDALDWMRTLTENEVPFTVEYY